MTVRQNVLRHLPAIRKIRASLGFTPDQYADSFVLAVIHYESKGDPKIVNQKTQNASGLFQFTFSRCKDMGVSMDKIREGNAEFQIQKYFQSSNKYRRDHEYVPDYIVIEWARGVGSLRKIKKLEAEHGKGTKEFLRAYAFLVGEFGSSDKTIGQNAQAKAKYTSEIQKLQEAYAKHIGEKTPVKWASDWKNVVWRDVLPPEYYTIYGKGKSTKGRKLSQEDLNFFITPEELRKGIVAQFYHISDWYLAARMADPESIKLRNSGSDAPQSFTGPIQPGTEAPEPERLQSTGPTQAQLDAALEGGFSSIDNPPQPQSQVQEGIIDERRRFVQSLVEAEFYRRRMVSRSVPAISGPFNPYPVAGFPALILTPGRPIIAYVEQVSHQISVGSGSGQTSVSCSAPRYWDEGEIWSWIGGEETDSWVMRNFPQWHNRKVVPTNNADPNTFQRKVGENGEPFLSPLDRFYQFMLGTTSIEYISNNAGKATDAVVEGAIARREPGALDVNPETLDILEYNKAIAHLENGRFAPGTLAHRFYGPHRPYDAVESTASVDSQIDYVERYGVRERELFEKFLGNRFDKVNGRVVVLGPTFGGDKVNGVQNSVIEYIKDLEKRDLDGGV